MFLKCRDENEQRRIDIHDPFDHRKSIEAGHLDIQKYQIGFERFDRANGLTTVGTSFNDLDVAKGLETQLQPLDGQWFVVDENGSYHARLPIGCAPDAPPTDECEGSFSRIAICGVASSSGSCVSYGSSRITVNPPSGGVSISKR